ncbi:MAG: hypothetical protein DCF15_14300 [Phormidesmis priestleyi]|uniref:Uncharacterized protein n=1 Tax=Phormidesmis priestleyi TaxID=268141 RepID=A0A2W4YZ01_9CYAN|nr:MAG: hypothetical protein DCF15_14300 [Phormidesmis priestleyi]
MAECELRAVAYNAVSRIAVIAMPSKKTCQSFLRIEPSPQRLLRERCDGKTFSEIEPSPEMLLAQSTKEIIAIPAGLLAELNESNFIKTVFCSTEEAPSAE